MASVTESKGRTESEAAQNCGKFHNSHCSLALCLSEDSCFRVTSIGLHERDRNRLFANLSALADAPDKPRLMSASFLQPGSETNA